MNEYVQVWRAKVPEGGEDRLLAVRPGAIAEAKRLCPELLRADLVNLGDGTWLDVLTWSVPDGEERLMARAEEFRELHAMHELLEDPEALGRGEVAPALMNVPPRDRDAELDVEALARLAADGDRDALTALVRQLQHPMYRLALRFLGHPDDAQDACQEILIRIVTHLGSFEGRSKFTTWAYTVATRSLLRTKKRFVESSVQGPEQFAAFLDAGMSDVDPTIEEAEYRLLCEEIRISCTYGMLLCIPRAQRAAYLLADVIGLTDVEVPRCSTAVGKRSVSERRGRGARCATSSTTDAA